MRQILRQLVREESPKVVVGGDGTVSLAVVAKRHQNLPKVTSLRAKQVRIETRRPMRVHCDDQIVGTTPVTIEADPKALRVIVERL